MLTRKIPDDFYFLIARASFNLGGSVLGCLIAGYEVEFRTHRCVMRVPGELDLDVRRSRAGIVQT